jgi:hypothetical protein
MKILINFDQKNKSTLLFICYKKTIDKKFITFKLK